jgi:hypothetical protein
MASKHQEMRNISEFPGQLRRQISLHVLSKFVILLGEDMLSTKVKGSRSLCRDMADMA